MRVLVCGGRDFFDREKLNVVLTYLDLETPVETVIHGAARGADAMAGEWARRAGKSVEEYPADWGRDGLAAGPRRNARMLRESRPDIVVAFPGGRGTADMVRRAKRAGVETVEER